MPFTDQEILETLRMVELETFDIRTTTFGISLFDCADPDLESSCEKVYSKIVHHGRNLVEVAGGIEAADLCPCPFAQAVHDYGVVAAAGGFAAGAVVYSAANALLASYEREEQVLHGPSIARRPRPGRLRELGPA